MNLIHGDCLLELKKIKDKSIDFVYCDLPYNQTACKWDKKIDHHALWIELKRIAKSDRTPFFFSCTTKFGFELFNSAPKGYFRWDLVWEKNRAAGFLNAYRLPMRKHEMVYCFAKKTPEYDVSSHLTGEEVEKKNDSKWLNETGGKRNSFDLPFVKSKVVKDPLPTSVLPPQEDHELVYCFAKKTPEYDVSSHKESKTGGDLIGHIDNSKMIENMTKPTYRTNTKHTDPLPTSVLPPQEDHELVYCFAKKTPEYDVSSHSEYTEQKEYSHRCNGYGKDKENKCKAKTHKDPLPTSVLPPQEDHELVYCFAKKTPEYDVSSHSEYTTQENKSNRNDLFSYEGSKHKKEITAKLYKNKLPTSVLDIPSSWCKFNLDEKVNHRTSKPVKLMEFLLKYWSKEGDTVLDPTAGSGSMGIACLNMNRKFIGIEKDDDIFQIMKDRIENHQKPPHK